MKSNRILYLSLLFLSFIFVYFYGGKVPYMLFYTVLLLPAISFLHAVAICFRFNYVQCIDKTAAIKGDAVHFTLKIINRDLFIYPYISVKFFGEKDSIMQQPSINNISLRPFGKKEYHFDYKCMYRGSFEIGVYAFEIKDFLGIFCLTRRNPTPLLLTVYPRIINLESFILNSNCMPVQFSTLNNRQRDSSEIQDIRKYMYGDSLKKVHWKLTAKVNDLMVKKYQSSANASVNLILDTKNFGLSSKKNAVIEDKHIETAIAVLKYCIDNNFSVNVFYYEKEMRIIRCQNLLDFESVYRVLARLQFNQHANINGILEAQLKNTVNNNPAIVIISSNVNRELYELLCSAHFTGCDVILIYISPEEITCAKTPEAEKIFSALTEAGIKAYSINISDDIKSALEFRAGETSEKLY